MKNHARIKVWVSLERYEGRLSGYVITFEIQGYFKDISRTFWKNYARIKLWMKLFTGTLPANKSLFAGTLKNLVFLQNLSSDSWPSLVRALEC